MNFVWVNSDVLVAGMVVTDLPEATSASIKRRRLEKASRVTRATLLTAIEHLKSLDQEELTRAQENAEQARLSLDQNAEGRAAIIQEILPTLQRTLHQSHDFLGLLKQITANVLAIFEERFPGMPAHEAASLLPYEGAIYFSAQLMDVKLDATKYLREPNLVYGERTIFTLHPFVTKYVRIYKSLAAQRALRLVESGESHGRVRYPNDPVGAIIQSLLDNAVKYAPAGSDVNLVFRESPDRIGLDFVSLGPRIARTEEAKIFRPGFRGSAAQEKEEGGMGLGLAIARTIADALQLELGITQDGRESPEFPGFYRTTFSVSFEILSVP